MKESKERLEKQYDLAILEFQTAHTEDEQFQARRSMARLEKAAMQDYGFEFADALAEKKNVILHG